MELSQISMDCAEIANDQEAGEARKLLVGRNRQSKLTFCHLAKVQGPKVQVTRVVKNVLQGIRETGNTKMVLKTDGEPAIVQLEEQIVTEREHKTLPQNSPAYDPQAKV